MFGSMVGPGGGEGVSGAVVGGCGSQVGAGEDGLHPIWLTCDEIPGPRSAVSGDS